MVCNQREVHLPHLKRKPFSAVLRRCRKGNFLLSGRVPPMGFARRITLHGHKDGLSAESQIHIEKGEMAARRGIEPLFPG
jgi:hypothetical protein